MGVSRSAFVLKDQCDSVSVNSPFLGYKFAKIRELHLLFLIFYASYLYFTNFSRTEICSFFSYSTILKCLGMLFLTNFLGLNWACHHLRKTKREKQVFFFFTVIHCTYLFWGECFLPTIFWFMIPFLRRNSGTAICPSTCVLEEVKWLAFLVSFGVEIMCI